MKLNMGHFQKDSSLCIVVLAPNDAREICRDPNKIIMTLQVTLCGWVGPCSCLRVPYQFVFHNSQARLNRCSIWWRHPKCLKTGKYEGL